METKNTKRPICFTVTETDLGNFQFIDTLTPTQFILYPQEAQSLYESLKAHFSKVVENVN